MKRAKKKKIIISVTSDLVSDNRVHKVSSTLASMGFEVVLTGRRFSDSQALELRPYVTRRMKLLFNKGTLFYACFNIRLFIYLLFSRFDILLANDLDTLPANYFISRIRQKPLIYDSHEYFTEVPELVTRPRVQRIWEWMEKRMVPHVGDAYTVCNSIAAIYTEKYKIPFHVVRNFPLSSNGEKNNISGYESPFILYQGAVNMGRGLHHAIRAMQYLEGIKLIIVGDGDLRKELESLVEKEGLKTKVEFRGRLSIDEVKAITPKALVGLSIEEDIGLNYRYALPNKLFDYIQARVPVLVTNLPEMAAVVQEYKIGEVISELNSRNLAKIVSRMIVDDEKRRAWKVNLEKASKELVWETEEKTVKQIFSRYI